MIGQALEEWSRQRFEFRMKVSRTLIQGFSGFSDNNFLTHVPSDSYAATRNSIARARRGPRTLEFFDRDKASVDESAESRRLIAEVADIRLSLLT